MSASQLIPRPHGLQKKGRRGGGMQASGFFLSPHYLASRQASSLFLGQVLSERQERLTPSLIRIHQALSLDFSLLFCIASSAPASLLRPSSSFFLSFYSIYLHGARLWLLSLSPNKPLLISAVYCRRT